MTISGRNDTAFSGSVPARYDRYLGPLLFEPYAKIVADQLKALNPTRILEVAAGTGILTAQLRTALPDAEIVATDLNPAMLEVAAARVPVGSIRFQPADALDLPFAEGKFDCVVCQFGVMFYPDKVKGNAEARRVLREGSTYLAIIWDRLDRNPVSHAMAEILAEEFPEDPPRFLERAPFSYSDPAQIEADLHAAGFEQVIVEAVSAASRVDARSTAYGMCCGSPMTAEIEERGADALDRAVIACERALMSYDGLEAPMSALFATATK